MSAACLRPGSPRPAGRGDASAPRGAFAEGAKAGENKFGDTMINLTGIKPGEVRTAEATRAPGSYELACQVVEEVGGKSVNHYEKGMYTTVTVR